MKLLVTRTALINCCVITGLAALLGCGSNNNPTLFKKIKPEQSGIQFNNVITENDSINPIDLEFLYNGGGVAVGDFNNDQLPDLYFTASTTSNKLYLNKGGLSFSDITEVANVTGEKLWANAASVVDINQDGWQDIYVSNSIKKSGHERRNLLYVNQGLNKDKQPTFKEMAAEYGLADTSFSVHAAFFDYDNDGDLDMYLLTTKLAQRDAARFNNVGVDTVHRDIDKLYKNDWNEQLKHPVFTDVSKQAGIVHPGFGLGVGITDINKDGWKDVYVTNDFFGADLLYINNGNGTFTNRINEYFKHTSQNAMGNDIADINNDGLLDVMAVDMNPEDNFRKKKNMNSNNYYVYQNMEYFGNTVQYVRNTLQLNMGSTVDVPDSSAHPVFADISFLSGVAETDWSWTPSMADFDNDGNRDIIITNGYPKDVTDHDFMAFRSRSQTLLAKQDIIAEIPQIKIPNYAYRNRGNLKFDNVVAEWGLSEPCFSSGAVYADLDNDGDLDYVINNINDVATLYENTLRSGKNDSAHYLTIQFKGDAKNPQGIGAWAEIYYDKGKMQVYENNPYRGYLSTVDSKAYFGLGKTTKLDSIVIRWPNNKRQKLDTTSANQLLVVDIRQATTDDDWSKPRSANLLFSDVTAAAGIQFRHAETDAIDFNRERLLPHKLSQYGPGLAAADVNGDGLDDVYIGGNNDFAGRFLLQTANGKFTIKTLEFPALPAVEKHEDMGVLLFDADNDGDNDLFCAGGSNEFDAGSKKYNDHFFVNDGKGNFKIDTTAIPSNYASKSCVKATDFDNDGDLDLFIGGRVIPGKYPVAASSFIYRNDSKTGQIKFTDVTAAVAKGLLQVGLVCDALWTDFDNDGATDLLIAGEWMPLTFFKNEKGSLVNVTANTGIANQVGWWNSITAGDFDNDGDIDYIAGNLGENSFYRGNDAHPASIYAKDFDKNGGFDAIPVIYMKDQQGKLQEYTTHNRDDIMEQLPVLKKSYLTYKDFAVVDIHHLFKPEVMEGALVLKANNFKSSFIRNNGSGKFECIALPVAAQLAPLYGMITDDFDGDGNLDVAISGNDFGTEVGSGRYDALNGLVMLGDGKGGFAPRSIAQSGLFIPGDGKALVKLRSGTGNYLLAGSQNKGPLKLFSSMTKNTLVPVLPGDKFVEITLKDGRKRKEEIYRGSSFLSQNAAFVSVGNAMSKVEITNNKGEKRVVNGQ